MTRRYRVHYRGRCRWFETLDGAQHFANEVFRLRNIVLCIEQVDRRRSKRPGPWLEPKERNER